MHDTGYTITITLNRTSTKIHQDTIIVEVKNKLEYETT